MFGLGVIKLES